jgi:hypothetical protein
MHLIRRLHLVGWAVGRLGVWDGSERIYWLARRVSDPTQRAKVSRPPAHLARQNSWRCPTLRLSPASAIGAVRPPAAVMVGFSWTAPSTSHRSGGRRQVGVLGVFGIRGCGGFG